MVATFFPTTRSMCTVAPSTGPAGPVTVPTRLASPGPKPRRVVWVVVGFAVLDVVVARTVVTVVGGTVVVVSGAAVGAGPAPDLEPLLQPLASRASTPTSTKRR